MTDSLSLLDRMLLCARGQLASSPAERASRQVERTLPSITVAQRWYGRFVGWPAVLVKMQEVHGV